MAVSGAVRGRGAKVVSCHASAPSNRFSSRGPRQRAVAAFLRSAVAAFLMRREASPRFAGAQLASAINIRDV